MIENFDIAAFFTFWDLWLKKPTSKMLTKKKKSARVGFEPRLLWFKEYYMCNIIRKITYRRKQYRSLYGPRWRAPLMRGTWTGRQRSASRWTRHGRPIGKKQGEWESARKMERRGDTEGDRERGRESQRGREFKREISFFIPSFWH